MTTLTREKIRKNLISGGVIDDATLSRLKAFYPTIDRCPTCNESKEYRLAGEVHPCDCEMQKLLQKHYFAANIGRAYHTLGFDHFVTEESLMIRSKIIDYLYDWDNNRYFGHGITFNGGLGTGKTLAMSIILKELTKRGFRTHFITFDDMVNIFGSAWNNDEAKYLSNKLRSVDILGIDELKVDSRNSSGFLTSAAESIIRHRTVNLLPTLITTNLDKEDEQKHFAKSYSLLSALNIRIETQGLDVRGSIVREREHIMKGNNERRPVN